MRRPRRRLCRGPPHHAWNLVDLVGVCLLDFGPLRQARWGSWADAGRRRDADRHRDRSRRAAGAAAFGALERVAALPATTMSWATARVWMRRAGSIRGWPEARSR